MLNLFRYYKAQKKPPQLIEAVYLSFPYFDNLRNYLNSLLSH